METKIIVMTAKLNQPKDLVIKGAKLDEPNLTKITTDYSNKLLDEQNIETFEQINNILITEKGYYILFFEDMLTYTPVE